MWPPMMRTVLLCGVLAGCASAKSDAPAPVPTHEVVTGGARLHGGKFSMDVQVGQGVAPRGPKLTNALVTP